MRMVKKRRMRHRRAGSRRYMVVDATSKCRPDQSARMSGVVGMRIALTSGEEENLAGGSKTEGKPEVRSGNLTFVPMREECTGAGFVHSRPIVAGHPSNGV